MLRARRGEVDRGRRGSNSTFDADETVHPSKLPVLPLNTLRMLIQPRHCFAELRAFEWLLEKVRAPEAHRAQQEILRTIQIGKDHVEIRHGLLQLFERPQALFNIE